MSKREALQVLTRRREVEVCDRCGAVDDFILITGPRKYSALKISYARCRVCGRGAKVRILQG